MPEEKSKDIRLGGSASIYERCPINLPLVDIGGNTAQYTDPIKLLPSFSLAPDQVCLRK